MATILIVDDEIDMCNLIEIYLKNEDYKCLKATNGQQALEILKNHNVDLILCDVMMPEMDGLTFVTKVRETLNTPIIMVSAKDQDMDKVLGLTAGADDYISKPFNVVELIARVKAQIRRNSKYNDNAVKNVYHFQDLTLDIDKRKVYRNAEEIILTAKEFDILRVLWQHKGMVMSAEQIYTAVWGEEDYDPDNTVMVHIRNLRKKIESDSRNPEYVVTVWGVGYKFGK